MANKGERRNKDHKGGKEKKRRHKNIGEPKQQGKNRSDRKNQGQQVETGITRRNSKGQQGNPTSKRGNRSKKRKHGK